ncbi:hypothetical protein CCZ01_05480 [Helicobacter monodelphidis]|uniref:HdrB C-terminal domain-containing protein n=1 Tax=Helicobacter sp. 15-1451 TaxID=2004995 RepID=UPI000DCF621C|nr:hypothetical protein [Helicobacter sp. 15-1451]RAX57593.1 hypothetical protein CCZ01_05480 [Helicobacter sp. 15-1451]
MKEHYTLIGTQRNGLFETSSQRLLKKLNLPLDEHISIAPDYLMEGLFPALHTKKAWAMSWFETLLHIKNQGSTPIFIEEGSYISALLAIKAIREDPTLQTQAILKELDSLKEVEIFTGLLNLHQDILSKQFQKNWRGFRATVCHSSFTLLRKVIEGDRYRFLQETIWKLIQLDIIQPRSYFESVAHLSSFNLEGALKENARVYYQMADLGIDFIITMSFSAFSFFENYQSKIKSAAGRELMDIPIIHIAELLLILMGEKPDSHKIPLGMI